MPSFLLPQLVPKTLEELNWKADLEAGLKQQEETHRNEVLNALFTSRSICVITAMALCRALMFSWSSTDSGLNNCTVLIRRFRVQMMAIREHMKDATVLGQEPATPEDTDAGDDCES